MKMKIITYLVVVLVFSVFSVFEVQQNTNNEIAEVQDYDAPVAGVIDSVIPNIEVTAKLADSNVNVTSVAEPVIDDKPYYVQVISDGLYIRKTPNTDGEIVEMLAKNDKVYVKNYADTNWLMVVIDNQWYYISKEYTTTEVEDTTHLVMSVNDIIKEQIKEPYGFEMIDECISITNADKERVAYHESGGSYVAHTHGTSYYGRYQLHYTLLNGDHSPENQERAAEEYVANRYGSWAKAKAHWLKYHWY